MSDKTDKPRNLVDEYLYLTETVLPSVARSDGCDWPVSEDHCFQRIVIDNVCSGILYEHLGRPAYKHLKKDQVHCAVELCQDIIDGYSNLQQLNRQSLIWRGNWLAPS